MAAEGKIIAVIGAPRSGKSFLVRKLAEKLSATAILEGEEGEFPARIEEDIRENIRPLERIIWFHTKLVKEFIRAQKLKAEGKTVLLDVFWIATSLYIDVLLEGFERDLVRDIVAVDRELLEWPDLTVYLKLSEEGMRNFVKMGGREFDQDEEVIVQQLLPLKKTHDEFFENETGGKILTIDRDNLDFEKLEDFEHVYVQIQKSLSS